MVWITDVIQTIDTTPVQHEYPVPFFTHADLCEAAAQVIYL